MHELRQGIRLRAYAQVNPVDEYKKEGFDMFEAMINGIKEEVVRRIYTVQIRRESPLQRQSVSRTVSHCGRRGRPGGQTSKAPAGAGRKKARPHDPCPCGKWKADGSRPLKYKECCGRNE